MSRRSEVALILLVAALLAQACSSESRSGSQTDATWQPDVGPDVNEPWHALDASEPWPPAPARGDAATVAPHDEGGVIADSRLADIEQSPDSLAQPVYCTAFVARDRSVCVRCTDGSPAPPAVTCTVGPPTTPVTCQRLTGQCFECEVCHGAAGAQSPCGGSPATSVPLYVVDCTSSPYPCLK
jgi:hypothetical protein